MTQVLDETEVQAVNVLQSNDNVEKPIDADDQKEKDDLTNNRGGKKDEDDEDFLLKIASNRSEAASAGVNNKEGEDIRIAKGAILEDQGNGTTTSGNQHVHQRDHHDNNKANPDASLKIAKGIPASGGGGREKTSIVRDYALMDESNGSATNKGGTKNASSPSPGVPTDTAIGGGTGDDVTMTSLRRDRQVSNNAVPGAWSSSGEFLGNPARPSVRGSNPPVLPDVEQPLTNEGSQDMTNSGLVVANEISESKVALETAEPVDPSRAESFSQRGNKQGENQNNIYCFAVLWLLLAIGLIIGLTVGLNNQDSNNKISMEETITVPGTTTMNPNTDHPSDVPTMAPTRPLDPLFQSLPTYTRNNVEIFDTPQQRAWNWLENHPDLETIPLWRQAQLFALVTFYHSFEGDNWKKEIKERWLLYDKNECLWFSSGFGYFDFITGDYAEEEGDARVESCNEQGEFTNLHVEGLDLWELEPVIPLELELIPSLQRLEVPLNNITRSFLDMWPTSQPTLQLPNITHLMVWGNDIHGRLPTEIGTQLPNLQEFHAWDNLFTGPIPSELFLLTSLRHVGIEATSTMTGTIPSELGLLTNMENFLVYGNQFSGPLPTEMGLMTALQGIDFNYCQLTGEIPSELGLLPNLVKISLGGNRLTGPIPSQLGQVTTLDQLQLQNNFLTGSLPFQLNSSMSGLNLGGNQLSGNVPEHFCERLLCECTSEGSPASTCLYLMEEPEWPGRFPSISQEIDDEKEDGIALMVNIKTDLWPEETSWVWQQESTNAFASSNESAWEVLNDSNGPMKSAQFVHSYPVILVPNLTYNLTVYDTWGDGITGGVGFVTITDANETVLFSVKARESFTVGDQRSSFEQLSVTVVMDEDGAANVTETIQRKPVATRY